MSPTASPTGRRAACCVRSRPNDRPLARASGISAVPAAPLPD
jgi:hypothetical protein